MKFSKKHLLFSLLPLSAFLFGACESEPYNIKGLNKTKSEFQIACEATGGVFIKDGQCKCNNVMCEEGLVCNSIDYKCPAYKPTGSCVGEEKTCVSGQMAKCNNGSWGDVLPCESGACLPDNSDCAECVVGICTQETNSANVQTCFNGKLQAVAPCTSGVCNSEGTACGKKCEKDETKCEKAKDGFGYLFSCSKDNEWEQAKKPCNMGCDADGKTCATQCIEGTYSCLEEDNVGTLYQCQSDRQYNEGTVCTKSKKEVSCNKTKLGCGSCLNGPISCEDDKDTSVGQYTACVNGEEHTTKTPCEGAVSCDGNKCGECNNLVVTCENDPETQEGTITSCADGKKQPEPCILETDKGIFKNSCKNDKECGICLNGDTMCVSGANLLISCVNGDWDDGTKCPAGCADDVKCKEE